jgi:hypothetical protein
MKDRKIQIKIKGAKDDCEIVYHLLHVSSDLCRKNKLPLKNVFKGFIDIYESPGKNEDYLKLTVYGYNEDA